MPNVDSLRRPIARALAGSIVSLVALVASCQRTDAPTASFFPKSSNATPVSFTLDPSVLRVSPGGSAETIGAIRGVQGSVLTAVLDMPSGVSARVEPAASSDSVITRKYTLFASAGVPFGTYALNVRVTVNGYTDAEAVLTLVVVATP
jgi:hypothetical protein